MDDALTSDVEESKNSRRSLQQPNKRRRVAPGVCAEGQGRKWRTEVEQQIYFSKLAEALRRPSPYARSTTSGRLVRETADRVLAAAAKGRTRWSRAILTNRVRRRLARRERTKKLTGRKPSCVAETKKEKKNLPAVQRRAKILGRLVPGCRKASFPKLLEEATDYISALEMQVRAMKALAELLAGAENNRLGTPKDS